MSGYIKSAGGWWIHTAHPENIPGIGDPLLPFDVLFAKFKDLGMCQTAPTSSLVWGLGEDEFYPEIQFCVWLNHGSPSALIHEPHARCIRVRKISPLPLPSFPLSKPSWCSPQILCGKVEQLIPCVGKYKTGNQGCAWEITLNVKTCWGSQLSFESLALILEFLQPVASSKASLGCAVCNSSAGK